jgi:nucleoside-diphosphate-sugar epimerase
MAFSLYGVTPGEEALFESNVRGTRNVARAAAAAGAKRLIYTSSAAVYGLRSDNPQPLTEGDDVRASARHFYSRHKAQCELLVRDAVAGSDTEAYLFRPIAIVGPHAAGAAVGGLPSWAPGRLAAGLRLMASLGLRPWMPTPPVPLQFVHEDDVAQAIELAVLGEGNPGVYNLAGDGVVVGPEVARLLGLRPAPLPRVVVEAALRAVAAVPPVLPFLSWSALITEPVLVDTTKAREQLGWRPAWDSRGALQATREGLGW